jgi:hypothetical protein
MALDDCLFVCKMDEKWIEEQIEMLKEKFEDVTEESVDELGLVGRHIQMDRDWKQVVIMESKHVDHIIETLKLTKGALSSALVKLMADDIDSPLLKDQSDYMSKYAMLMF